MAPIRYVGMVAESALLCALFASPLAQAQDPRPYTRTLSANLNKKPDAHQLIIRARELTLADLKTTAGISRGRIDRFAKLTMPQLIERLAVDAPVGPSTIAAPRPGASVPSPSVNWGSNGGATTGHPGVALLLAKQPGEDTFNIQCTGMLVRQNIVLTASHCICYSEDPSANYATGAFCQKGDTARTASPLLDGSRWLAFFQHVGLREVQRVEINTDYEFGDTKVRGDIAALVLTRAVTEIAPPMLPTGTTSAQTWSKGTIVGFGFSTNPNEPQSRVLQQLVLPGLKSQGQVSSVPCTSQAYLDPLGSLCSLFDPSPGGSSTICGGDSGGPLWDFVNAAEIGVNSGRNQENCAAKGTIAFQMSVSYSPHSAWINGIVQKFSSATVTGRWPVFGENLLGVVDRRNAQVFDENGTYESTGWMKLDQDSLVLVTINSSGRVTKLQLQDRAGHTLCKGSAGSTGKVPNVDLCTARIAAGLQFHVVAEGTQHEFLQFVVTTHDASASLGR